MILAGGSFIKSIPFNRLKRLKIGRETHYVYLDWGRKGLAFDFNADTGEFLIYIDNIDLDNGRESLITKMKIQIDDTAAENFVTFKEIRKKKGK